MATSTKNQKQADIRYRVELKDKPYIVIYQVRSSDDTTDYEVTLISGKVSSCTCPAHGYGHVDCYIKRDVQARENERYMERYKAGEAAQKELAKAEADAYWGKVEDARRESAPLNGNRAFSLMR